MSELKTHIEIEEQYYFSDNDYDSCHEIICRELEAHEQAEYPEVDEKGVIAYTNDPAHAELICNALNAKPDTVTISRECKWVQDDDSVDRYDTYCGQSWEFNDGGVEQNGMNYCHSCGGKIVEIQSMEGVWV